MVDTKYFKKNNNNYCEKKQAKQRERDLHERKRAKRREIVLKRADKQKIAFFLFCLFVLLFCACVINSILR